MVRYEYIVGKGVVFCIVGTGMVGCSVLQKLVQCGAVPGSGKWVHCVHKCGAM